MYGLLQTNARKVYARITQSRITTFFFVFSLIYCCAQIILQSLIFSVDSKYAHLLSGIIEAGNLPPANFTYLQGKKGHMNLQMCDDIPFGRVHPCTTIYDSTSDSMRPQVLYLPQVLDNLGKNLTVISMLSPFNATQVIGVQIKTDNGSTVNLNERCVQILLYPYQLLQNFKDEDVTSLCLQIWLLGISFIVILYGSVPHTLCALTMRTISTGWAMYTTWRGPTFAANFRELIVGPTSPCSLDLFSTYWETREVYEIIDFILSSTGLIIFSYLSWAVLKVYNVQSVKCVGAPAHVMGIQKFFMALLSNLYLEVFVLINSFGLWRRNLSGAAVEHISAHAPVHKAIYIVTIILLLPWIAMGWYSIRHEMKRMMVAFLGIGFVLTVGWLVSFCSEVNRWSFLQWPYLACYTVVSFILLIVSMVLGIICRVNFGKGLAQYLHAESTLASLNFSPGLFSHDNTIVPPTPTGVNDHRLKRLDVRIIDPEDPYSQVYFIKSLSKKDSSPENQQLPPYSQKNEALSI